jgi:hypothetical protein
MSQARNQHEAGSKHYAVELHRIRIESTNINKTPGSEHLKHYRVIIY